MSSRIWRICRVCGGREDDHDVHYEFKPLADVAVVWIWHEDDAPVPDKERWSQAWERIFQSTNPDLVKIADHGDATDYAELWTGRVVRHACDGSSIGLLVDMLRPEPMRVSDFTDTIDANRTDRFTRWFPKEKE